MNFRIKVLGKDEHAYATIADEDGGWIATVKTKYAEAVMAAISDVAANANGSDQRESAVIRKGALQDEQANGNSAQSQPDSHQHSCD